jgi:predicted acylesterase/phospholipase RssA
MGGGAKGAYEVGVWKALWDLGIRKFCTVAGTSVGALNAVLVAQHDPKKVEEIWTSIMTAGVLEAPKRRWTRRLLWCLAYVLIFLPVIVALSIALPIDFATPTSWLHSRFAGFLIMSMGFYIRWHATLLKKAAKAGMMIPFFILNIEQYDNIGQKVWQLGLLNVVIAAFQTKSVFDITLAYWGFIPGYLLAMGSLLLGMHLLMRTLMLTPLFDREHLSRLIGEISDTSEFPNSSGPVWATLSHYSIFHDPFQTNPLDFELRDRISNYPARDWRGEPVTAWTPFYVDLRCQADYAWVLEATSAIPFAFKGIRHDGQLFVDGGACDNLPIAPAVHESPEHVIVVGVNADDELPDDLQGVIETRWRDFRFSTSHPEELDRLRRNWVATFRLDPQTLVRERETFKDNFFPRMLGISLPVEKYNTPTVAVQSQANFLLLKPSEPTSPSGPVRKWTMGTLNFNLEYMNRLIKLGYNDTMRVIGGGSSGGFT